MPRQLKACSQKAPSNAVETLQLPFLKKDLVGLKNNLSFDRGLFIFLFPTKGAFVSNERLKASSQSAW